MIGKNRFAEGLPGFLWRSLHGQRSDEQLRGRRQLGVGVVFHSKDHAGPQIDRVGRKGDGTTIDALCVLAALRQGLTKDRIVAGNAVAIGDRGVFAAVLDLRHEGPWTVVEYLVLAFRVRRSGRLAVQAEGGLAEVVVSDDVCPDIDFVTQLHVGDELELTGLVGVVGELELVFARRQRVEIVTKRELRAFLVVVREVVRDACLGNDARQKIEVALVVLDLVFELRILAPVQLPSRFDFPVLPVLEQLIDDVRNVLVLEDAEIGPLGQQPSRGHDVQHVGRLGLDTP